MSARISKRVADTHSIVLKWEYGRKSRVTLDKVTVAQRRIAKSNANRLGALHRQSCAGGPDRAYCKPASRLTQIIVPGSNMGQRWHADT